MKKLLQESAVNGDFWRTRLRKEPFHHISRSQRFLDVKDLDSSLRTTPKRQLPAFRNRLHNSSLLTCWFSTTKDCVLSVIACNCCINLPWTSLDIQHHFCNIPIFGILQDL